MATYRTRKGRSRSTVTATVRLHGYRSVSRTFDTKGQAKAWAAEVEEQIRRKRYRDPRAGRIPLGVALDEYDRRVTVKKKPVTRRRELVAARALRAGFGENTLLTDITPKMVAFYRDARLAQVATAYPVRLELALLSHLYRTAIREWELPLDNPVDSVQRPPAPQGRMVFLELDQAKTLLAECRSSKNELLYPYVLLLLHTAMRPSEAATVTAGQVDLAQSTIILHETKNRSRRTVPLTRRVIAALRPLIAGKKKADYVFLSRSPAYTSYATVPAQRFRISFNLARDRAGLEWLHMHDLRHTAASWMLMRGVDIRTLAAVLGHRTLQMVLRYTHLNDQAMQAAVKKIEDLGI